jgi:hypothetical protein
MYQYRIYAKELLKLQGINTLSYLRLRGILSSSSLPELDKVLKDEHHFLRPMVAIRDDHMTRTGSVDLECEARNLSPRSWFRPGPDMIQFKMLIIKPISSLCRVTNKSLAEA